MTITDTIRAVWKYLTKYMTPEGAAGVMGNLYAESGIIPNKVETLCLTRLKEAGKVYTDATYTAFVDDGTITRAQFLNPLVGKQYGYGLAQWTSPDRKAALYDLAKAKKVSVGNLDMQLEFLVSEMRASYKSVWEVVTTTHGIKTASDVVLLKFEQPADTMTAVRNKRYQYSMEVYNAMAITPAQTALKWMIDLASDQTHGYSQQSRWGPDYDCSSAVISAYQAAGVPVKSRGATYTGNMRSVFLACGFKDVTASCNLTTGAGMLPGDVLLNEFGKGTSGNGHAAMYVGDGKMVHARGQSYGSSKTGDQGTEIAVTAYRNHPFELVLRYGETAPTPSLIVGECSITMPLLLQGAVCNEVKVIQAMLNAKGYKGKNGKALTLDGELGENTAYAITNLQKKAGMTGINFGSVAKATWELILK
ncbi:MAG: C40 family peptidase [Clostridia bacterium]|nr:C40 family peptidase [Clostridia bacterium]